MAVASPETAGVPEVSGSPTTPTTRTIPTTPGAREPASAARPGTAARARPAPGRGGGGPVRTLWRSTIGKKAVMAATGLVMLLWLIAHMAGNLKIFFGPTDFNGYAHWLRRIGEPVLHEGWFLWIQRAVLLACVGLHAVAAYQLSRRDLRARPRRYQHRRPWTASYATNTMRFGGIILALFIVYHLLDLTALTLNPRGQAGHPYQNIVADFQIWYVALAYIVAMLALCLHIAHGFWSAAQTLGVGSAARGRALRIVAGVLAIVISAGFLAVPVAVMAGLVD